MRPSLPAYTSLNTAWPQVPTDLPAILQAADFPPSIEADVQLSHDSRKRRRTNDAVEDDGYDARPSASGEAFADQNAVDASQAMLQKSRGTVATDAPVFDQTIISPSFNFDSWASDFSLAPEMLDANQSQLPLDSFFSLPQTMDQQTPGGMSASGSAHTEGDKDPFMSLLEQLAENEQSRGGPSDLDFFLDG